MTFWRHLTAKTERTAPGGAVWTWRPPLWTQDAGPWTSVATETRLGPHTKLFHDCPLAEISVRQARDSAPPIALEIEVFAFRGAFLSLAVDLPTAGIAGMASHHNLWMDLHVGSEKPLELFCRLNLRHGPNTATLVRETHTTKKLQRVGFDLAFAGLGQADISHAWIDLIFEAPQMNRIVVHDLTLERRMRVEV